MSKELQGCRMNSPYPGFPPNYKEVPSVNGLARQCLVIEFQSLGQLSTTEMAVIREQIEGTINALTSKMSNIENSELVQQDRFDPILTEALRLKRSDKSK